MFFQWVLSLNDHHYCFFFFVLKSECESARQAVAKQKELLRERDKELNDLQQRQDNMKQEINEKTLNIKEFQIGISKLQNAIKDSANKVLKIIILSWVVAI